MGISSGARRHGCRLRFLSPGRDFRVPVRYAARCSSPWLFAQLRRGYRQYRQQRGGCDAGHHDRDRDAADRTRRTLAAIRSESFLLGGVVIASGPFFAQTNEFGYERTSRFAELWVIVLLGLLTLAYPKSKERVAIAALAALSLGVVFAGFFLDAESVRALLRYHAPSVMAQGISVTGPGMERLKFYEYNEDNTHRFDNGHYVVDHVNDGLALLEKSSTQDESVLTIGYENPFEYILRRKPALGGSPWEAVDINFPRTHLLDESLVFGNADLIMVPNYPNSNEESDMILAKAYHSYLLQHFTFVANSQWWSLYRRKR